MHEKKLFWPPFFLELSTMVLSAWMTATIREPKAIDPSEVVVARAREEPTTLVRFGSNHQLATTPEVVTWPMFRKTSAPQ